MNAYPLITPLVGVSGSRGSDPQTRGGTGKKKAKRHRGCRDTQGTHGYIGDTITVQTYN